MRRTRSNAVVLGLILLLLLAMLGLAGCVPGPNELEGQPNEDGVVAGFLRGLWNGVIAPFIFVWSLFNDDVHMYEVHNNGNWYNFGFLLGLSIILGGGAGGGAGATRRR
jgi:hypothetical protein